MYHELKVSCVKPRDHGVGPKNKLIIIIIINNINNNPYTITVPTPWLRSLKACCFELILRNAALVWFSVGEEFSANVWDQCQPSNVKDLGSCWFLTVVPTQKVNNDWETRRPDTHVTSKLTEWSFTSICGQMASSSLAGLTFNGL